MKLPAVFSSLAIASLMSAPVLLADDTKHWSFDFSLYGLAVGMSGDMGVGPVNADVNTGFDTIVENLEFGGMAKFRVGYDRWSFTTDALYMGLQASKNGVTAELDQWMAEPTIAYRVCKYFEPLAGARYMNLSGELRGPGVLPNPRIPVTTQDWWDPIVGANFGVPLGESFSINLRGDIGGFGAGSDLAWQLHPYISWRFSSWASLQAGYRWLDVDYENGDGADRFKYDMLNQGAQIGITFHF